MAAQAESKSTDTNVTRLPAKARSAAKKTTKRATTTARKTVRTTAKKAKKAVRATATATTKTIDTATRAATAKNPADAMNAWTGLFQQSPFKMETFMTTSKQQPFGQSFPQFDDIQKTMSQFMPQMGQFGNFQNQFQTKANDATDFASKASQAAEKSRNRLAAGVEECSKTMASMAQSNMQRSNEAMRTLMTCKSLNELADVQTRLFKQNFEAMSAETSRLVDQITRTLTSVSEPISDLTNSALSAAKKAAKA